MPRFRSHAYLSNGKPRCAAGKHEWVVTAQGFPERPWTQFGSRQSLSINKVTQYHRLIGAREPSLAPNAGAVTFVNYVV